MFGTNGKSAIEKTTTVETSRPKLVATPAVEPRATSYVRLAAVISPILFIAYLHFVFVPEMRSASANASTATTGAEKLHKEITDDRLQLKERIKEAEDARARAIVQEASILSKLREIAKLTDQLKKGVGNGGPKEK